MINKERIYTADLNVYGHDPFVMKKDDDKRSNKFFDNFVLHEIQIWRARSAMHFG